MNQTFESFLAKRLINEYTGLCKKHKVEHSIISAKDFSKITYSFYIGQISKKDWIGALEYGIKLENKKKLDKPAITR